MEKISIPFLPEWENLMLTGKKSATSRTKRYGYPGDYFEAFGRQFVLVLVYRIKLCHIAHSYYLEEGCNSDLEFIRVWKRIHPKKGYRPEQEVYLHKFRLQGEMCPFHVHELAAGKCRICGCDPTPIEIINQP